MFKKFSGGGSQSWPLSKIVGALGTKYDEAAEVGEDGALKVFRVEDNGVNFVVAVMQTEPDSGKVVELMFFARFVDFPVDARMVESINRNLHMSVASLEGPDLFLVAPVQVNGAFNQREFLSFLESWRRDLMVTLHGISGEGQSFANTISSAKMDAVREFAANTAPKAESGMPIDVLSQFLGDKDAMKRFCDSCGGRGKRGLIARSCPECDGSGFTGR